MAAGDGDSGRKAICDGGAQERMVLESLQGNLPLHGTPSVHWAMAAGFSHSDFIMAPPLEVGTDFHRSGGHVS